jgi:hypothetical protein
MQTRLSLSRWFARWAGRLVLGLTLVSFAGGAVALASAKPAPTAAKPAAATAKAGKAGAPADAARPASDEPTEAPKSVFVFDPKVGKDPFFPKSARVNPPVVPPRGGTNPVSTLDLTFVLQGLSFVDGRKLALINQRTFAEGEEQNLRIKGQTNRVKCVEIMERSVVISVGGATRKLDLRPGL